jgi:transcription elongation factor GreA
MERYPITKEGYGKMQAEHKQLKNVERPAVIEQIATAREYGDLKENAEYKAAREKQGFIEGQLQNLEARISRAEIIDPSTLSGLQVMFGAIVTLEDLETETKKTYQIVGDYESDLNAGKIAHNSPIARGVIGKEQGDVVEIQTPKGLMEYEIIKVEYK